MFLTRNREGIKNNDLVPNIDSKNYLLENLEITINYLIETLKSHSLYSRYYHNSHCNFLLDENYLKCHEVATDVNQ